MPIEVRKEIVAAYRESGLTMAEYVRREKLNYATFVGWVARSHRPAEQKEKPAIKFAEVRLPAMERVEAGLLEVRLVDGTVLRGGRVADVAALVRALRS